MLAITVDDLARLTRVPAGAAGARHGPVHSVTVAPSGFEGGCGDGESHPAT